MNQHRSSFDANHAPLLLGVALMIAVAMTACSLRSEVERSLDNPVGLQKLADDGDPEAQFELGRKYYYGRGVPENLRAAFSLFTTAANHGSLRAQTALAVMYIEGLDIPRDVEAGKLWMQRAASEGYPSAIARLGYMYMMGIGMKQDFREGIRLLENAAAHDEVFAEAVLGVAYLNGTGIAPNPKLGVSLVRKAARQNPSAMEALAKCYDLGVGVERDPVKAQHWHELASKTRAGLPEPNDLPLVGSFR